VRFASLGSGSEGNGLIVEAGANDGRERPWRVMVDCGFGVKAAEARLLRLGIEPSTLDAILVTHEHGDHIGGVFSLARRHGLTVWGSHGTLQAVMTARFPNVAVHVCSSHARFAVGPITASPFPVPHDAREPTQFVFDDGRHRLGLLTDAGRGTPHIIDSLSGCDGLVMECNHDRAMLEASDYPYPLKRRIGGDYGHLSNDVAAEIVSRLDRSKLRRIVAAHLSRANNTVELARAALASATGWDASRIDVASQDAGLDWIDLAQA
jgi:phosphoribosyl 1,2-cyclic phosphodiesterase